MNDARFEPSRIRMRTLGEIAEVQLGKTPRKADYLNEGAYKIVKFRDIMESFEIDWKNSDKGFVADTRESLSGLREIRVGDVLVTASAHMSEHIGKKAALVKVIPARFKAAFVVGEILQIRLKPGVDPRWVLYYIRSRDGYKAIQNRVHGVHLISSRAREIAVPIGDFDQQQRVLGEIEKQFSRLDEAIADLKRVKANLKRYKAAVLKGAVEGRLVSTEAELARREGRSYETGAQLLQHVLNRRRTPLRGKWIEPDPPDITDLPKLPIGWEWASIDQIATDTQIGLDRRRESQNEEHRGSPYVKMNNVNLDGNVSWDGLVYVEASENEQQRFGVRDGDLLFNTRNSTELVGKVGLVLSPPERAIYNNNLMRIRVASGVLPAFVCAQMCSMGFRARMEKIKRATTNVAAVYAKDLLPLAIAVPPTAEQLRVVAELDRRLSMVREVEHEVDANLQRAERLRQATLQEAFAGASSAR